MRTRGIFAAGVLAAACGGGLGTAQVAALDSTGKATGTSLGNRVLAILSSFAWVDANQGYKRGPDGNWVIDQRERKNLQIRLLGAAIDPREDLRQKSIAEVLQIAQDLNQNGFISLFIVDFDKVVINARLKAGEVTTDGPLFVLDTLQFGITPLTQDYPQTVTSLGSDRDFIIEFTRIERVAGGAIEGTLEMEFKRKAQDPTDAVIGKMNLKFSAAVVPERIAECNDDTSWGTNLAKYDDAPECQDP